MRHIRDNPIPFAVAATVLLAGCISPYRPGNVYWDSDCLPYELRRVAVLPLTVGRNVPHAAAGREALEPVLRAELDKRRAFESVLISPTDLQVWSSQPAWAATDEMPAHLPQMVGEKTGSQAVLFCQLTQFHPYPPIMVGWNLKLVDCRDNRILWAVDEVFDAGRPAVAGAANHFFGENIRAVPGVDRRCILLSPRQFGRYAAHAAVATMPARGFTAQVSRPLADKPVQKAQSLDNGPETKAPRELEGR